MNSCKPEQGPVTIESLPAELLAHVFIFLDAPAPSDLRLHDQPNVDMLRPADPQPQPLKAVSLVHRRWRANVLPLLFRNAVWYLDRFDLMQAEYSKSPSAVALLSFIQANNLSSYVKSLTLFIEGSTRTTGQSDVGVGLYRRGDGSGHYGYSPDPFSPSPRRHGGAGEKDLVFNEDTNWLWQLLFDIVSPLRFTIIASPRVLASLTARMLFLGDEWIFSQSHHVLSLSRDETRAARLATGRNQVYPDIPLLSSPSSPPEPPSRPSSSSSSSRAPPPVRISCNLFTIRPWTSLLLNEGSSTQVYKTYEYFHRRPPSILGALLGAEDFPNDVALVPSTLREFSYVGIFPLSDHFSTLVEFLPRIERLFVQLVPRNDILKDRREMKGLDMDDLWAERNSAYAHIMPKLFEMVGNWQYLQVFETGDAADVEGWRLAVDLIGNFTDWRVEREGVFVRKTLEDN